MTFKLAHHNKILTVLESLDPEVLKKGSAYFGGGTLLTLDFGEYRWSSDIVTWLMRSLRITSLKPAVE